MKYILISRREDVSYENKTLGTCNEVIAFTLLFTKLHGVAKRPTSCIEHITKIYVMKNCVFFCSSHGTAAYTTFYSS